MSEIRQNRAPLEMEGGRVLDELVKACLGSTRCTDRQEIEPFVRLGGGRMNIT